MRYLLFLLSACTALTTQAQTSIFTSLTATENAPVALTLDLTALIAHKKEGEYQQGTVSAPDGANYTVDVRARGKYRRKIAVWPPLKLKFNKAALLKAGFSAHNEVKLSLPCYDNEQGNELIVREYLAYRMYEKIAPVGAIRARLIRLTLRDTHEGKTTEKVVTAMLLEDEEEIAARLKGKMLEEFGVSMNKYHVEQAATMVLFQYFVGNTDWDLSMTRNLRLVKPLDKKAKLVVLPYDFDFSGFVNAPYATPAVESKIRSVRDRHLKAGTLPPEALKQALQTFKNKAPELLALCDSPYLSPAAVSDLKNYVGFFFTELEGKEEVPERMLMR